MEVDVNFVFMDLRTTDRERSRSFYGELFGWSTTESLFTADDGPWGGLTQLAPGDGRQPQWVPYAPVDDLDDALARAVELGATATRPRVDLPQGSVAVIEDPTGATLALWQPRGR
jgi:predicted enzyme related to lactoylglutathione lyase